MDINTTSMIKVTNTPDHNWSLYFDGKSLWSIANKPEEGTQNSWFGNIRHVISIIYKYGSYKINDFTAAGLQLIINDITPRGYTLNDLFNK